MPSAGRVLQVSARRDIEAFFRRDAAVHLYELGDLDPFFWPHTRWFGLAGRDDKLRALALLYTGTDLPVLLALGRNDPDASAELVAAIAGQLPARLYSQLAVGLRPHLGERWRATPHGRHLKMELSDLPALAAADDAGVDRLGVADRPAIERLYQTSYPGNWFDARMLETGEYFGIWRGGALVCVAGVHVYSRQYRVAALGNVTTDQGHRGQGLARRAVARLCNSLLRHVDIVGLNVKADNAAAIRCYAGLGFREVSHYEEFMLEG